MRPPVPSSSNDHQRLPLTSRVIVLMVAIVIAFMLLPVVLDARRRESDSRRSVPCNVREQATPSRQAMEPERMTERARPAPAAGGQASPSANSG